MLPGQPVPALLLRQEPEQRGPEQREPELPVRLPQAQKEPGQVRPVPEQRALPTGGGRVFRPSRPAWIRALMRTPGRRREAS